VVVGVIGRAHGLRGEVGIGLRTDEPERRFGVGTELIIQDGRRRLTVESTRQVSGGWLVKFRELPDRTAVEQTRGSVLLSLVDPDEQPADDQEFYDRQLFGLSVLRHDGAPVGTVGAILHLPAQDLLSVQTPMGERLVPFVAALVPVVDLAGGFVQLADVAGLLEDLDDEDGTH